MGASVPQSGMKIKSCSVKPVRKACALKLHAHQVIPKPGKASLFLFLLADVLLKHTVFDQQKLIGACLSTTFIPFVNRLLVGRFLEYPLDGIRFVARLEPFDSTTAPPQTQNPITMYTV
ncbi:hypothetical protein [Candidatus Hepatobacter penaei]|uniref:hypothetical protein n=1 Tax=Candidatus Hepatobacter penaei TaxID=1274402 RepID=UPI0004F258A9|nr:hypothetical protein [Candidatus Hepatobacter penaei]